MPGRGAHWGSAGFGAWLLASPLMMEYPERALLWSDFASGAAILALSLLLLARPSLDWLKWLVGGVGLWLTVAPLVFWAPDSASFANDTIVGTLVIVFSVILPSLYEKPGGALIPPGWNYNPSTWGQRIPIIGLAFSGFLLARYLSAFQLGHIPSVWEPFFGKGTETILTSDVSRAFPVSDAGLGSWSYLLDALAGIYGGTRRWRTAPWVVVLFGIMIIPPGATSIILVILQPVAVGAWCTICLATAVIMLLMVPPAIDEVVASFQILRRARKEGHSLWSVFWSGVPELKGEPELRIAPPRAVPRPPRTLIAVTILGLWLMAVPGVFDAQPGSGASNLNYFAGALVITFAVIACAAVARPVRFVNVLLGVGVAAGIGFVSGGSGALRFATALAGVLIAALSIPAGTITDRFGTYDRVARWTPGKAA